MPTRNPEAPDEGQDFTENYWVALDVLLQDSEESLFYIFYDPNQAIYIERPCFPFEDAPFLLTENCRNTAPIHKCAYRFYEGDDVDPPDVEGDGFGLLDEAGSASQARAIKRLVGRLLRVESIAPKDIAVLVLSRHITAYEEALRNAGPPDGIRWSFGQLWEPNSVVVDMVRRFKGLEAAVVILWGFDTIDSGRDRGDLYVALSRATSRVWLVGERDVVDGALGGLPPLRR